jgi:hypothetical protein
MLVMRCKCKHDATNRVHIQQTQHCIQSIELAARGNMLRARGGSVVMYLGRRDGKMLSLRI